MGEHHSILSPSAAKRWILCPASIAACKDEPRSTNRASALGSAKHNVADHILKNPDKHMTATATGELAQADGFSFPVDAEFADHVNTYLSHARSLGGDQSYEQWVSTEPLWGIPGQGGTIDFNAQHIYDGYVDVLDAKFGYTYISPDSPQTKIYLLAKMHELDPEGILFPNGKSHISQPKLRDILESREFTRAELDEWNQTTVRPAAHEAFALYTRATDGTLTPADLNAAKKPSDEACEWCPIRTKCGPRLAQLNSDFPIMPAPPVVNRPITYDPGQMTAAELDHALTRVDSVVKFISDWAENIRAEGIRRAHANELPGWGIYEGKKGARQVPEADRPIFEEIVRLDLGNDAYEPPKLKTPTQLEATYKRLGKVKEWRDIQDGPEVDGVRKGGFVVQAAGAHSLMRTTAGGKPIADVIAAEFGLVETR